MKRLFIAAAVVLVAALGAAPFATGYLMQATLNDVEHFPGVRDALSLEVTDYRRGYLESQAESELQLRLPEGETLRLNLVHRIDQLPGVDGRYATVHTRWQPEDPALKRKLEEVFGDQVVLRLTTALYPNGSSHSTGRVPAIDAQGVRFSGADLALDTRRDGRFDYRIAAERLSVTDAADGVDKGARLDANGLRLAASGQVADDGFVWDGEARVELDELDVAQPTDEARIRDLAVRFDSARQDDGRWGFTLGYEVGEAELDERSFRDASLRLEVERLDADAMRALVQRLEGLQQLAGRGADIDEAAGQALLAELPQLLNRGPRVAIAPMQATTAEGETSLSLSAELPGGLFEGEPNPMMWMAVLSALVIEGQFHMPLELLEKQAATMGQRGAVEQQLAPLLAQGWIEVDDKTLSTSIDYRQGNLTLNGNSANQLLNMLLGG
ncbi:DUF945 family protein [Guyparkeria sp. 1SP6A2]|nr:DUF945 family protein [Guyparkeria sp. 1SP6A2]